MEDLLIMVEEEHVKLLNDYDQLTKLLIQMLAHLVCLLKMEIQKTMTITKKIILMQKRMDYIDHKKIINNYFTVYYFVFYKYNFLINGCPQ